MQLGLPSTVILFKTIDRFLVPVAEVPPTASSSYRAHIFCGPMKNCTCVRDNSERIPNIHTTFALHVLDGIWGTVELLNLVSWLGGWMYRVGCEQVWQYITEDARAYVHLCFRASLIAIIQAQYFCIISVTQRGNNFGRNENTIICFDYECLWSAKRMTRVKPPKCSFSLRVCIRKSTIRIV